MMSDELKPCPKCGGYLALATTHREALVLCRGCNAEWRYPSVIDAVAAHLARPVEDALRAENAALKARWVSVDGEDWKVSIAELAEFNAYSAKWQSVPWDAFHGPDTFDNSARIGAWVRAYEPTKSECTP